MSGFTRVVVSLVVSLLMVLGMSPLVPRASGEASTVLTQELEAQGLVHYAPMMDGDTQIWVYPAAGWYVVRCEYVRGLRKGDFISPNEASPLYAGPRTEPEVVDGFVMDPINILNIIISADQKVKTNGVMVCNRAGESFLKVTVPYGNVLIEGFLRVGIYEDWTFEQYDEHGRAFTPVTFTDADLLPAKGSGNCTPKYNPGHWAVPMTGEYIAEFRNMTSLYEDLALKGNTPVMSFNSEADRNLVFRLVQGDEGLIYACAQDRVFWLVSLELPALDYTDPTDSLAKRAGETLEGWVEEKDLYPAFR